MSDDIFVVSAGKVTRMCAMCFVIGIVLGAFFDRILVWLSR